jgi:hypothetical protein
MVHSSGSWGRRSRGSWLVLAIAASCAPPPTAPQNPPPAAVPGTLTWSGRVIAQHTQAPVAGAVIEATQSTPVIGQTDSDGQFKIGSFSKGLVQFSISAPGFLLHRSKVDLTGKPTDFTIELIPSSEPFDLGFYRQLARGTFDGPMTETRPWTMDPSFHFQTVTADTGQPVPVSVLDKIEAMFLAAVPELTAGRFRVATVERGPTTPGFRQGGGLVLVQFYENYFNGTYAGDSFVGGNTGRIRLLLNPELEAQYGHILGCGSMAARAADHEIVHAMGFMHTSDTWGDFQSGEGCPGQGRPERVRYHAAVVYTRPPGNTDIDTDRGNFSHPLAEPIVPAAPVSCGLGHFIR